MNSQLLRRRYLGASRIGLRRLESSIERGANHLLSLQTEEGFWLGELEADTTLESDYIYYLFVLGKADPDRIAKLATYVRRRQLEDGGWSIYPGGPSELNATCKAYFALKLAGDPIDSPHMTLARASVHNLGGLELTNSYTRFYLALVGAVGWELVPAIPPELMLLPNWFYINIYEFSSWTRAIVIPMMILSALRPNWKLPERAQVDELFRGSHPQTRRFRLEQAAHLLAEFFPGPRSRLEILRAPALGSPCANGPCAKPNRGSSSTWSAPKAWAPSIRR